MLFPNLNLFFPYFPFTSFICVIRGFSLHIHHTYSALMQQKKDYVISFFLYGFIIIILCIYLIFI